MPSVSVDLCCEIRNENNARDHWAVKAKRVKSQRRSVVFVMRAHTPPPPDAEVWVYMVRHGGPRAKLFDDDGLVSGFKAIRDQLAEWMGRDDSAKANVHWFTRQELGAKRATSTAEIDWQL